MRQVRLVMVTGFIHFRIEACRYNLEEARTFQKRILAIQKTQAPVLLTAEPVRSLGDIHEDSR